MSREDTDVPPSTSDQPPGWRWLGLYWADVALASLITLVIAVPTLAIEEDWHGRPMIDEMTNLWIIAVVVVVFAFVVGGAVAGYRRPTAAARHAAAATACSVAALLFCAVFRRHWVAHEGLPYPVFRLWVAGFMATLIFGVAGSLVGRRFASG